MLRRSITAREFITALTRSGFSLRRVRGSHRIYPNPDGRRVSVAYHGLGEVKRSLSARYAQWFPTLVGAKRIWGASVYLL